MGTSYSPQIATSGLALCLDAANIKSYPGSGTSWNDISGNALVATMSSTLPTFATDNGGVLVYPTGTPSVLVPYTPLLDPAVGITIEFWIYPTDITYTTYIEILRREGPSRTLFAFQNIGTILSFGTATSVTGYSEQDIPIVAGDYVNQWIHLVATYTSGAKVVYRNGAPINTLTTTTGTLLSVNAFTAIGSMSGGSEYFRGKYSVVRQYNRALTADEVAQNFNALRGRFGL
jgi:hypothetical protein